MVEKYQPTPPNFSVVWHQGDFNIGEIYTNQIGKRNPENGKSYPIASTYRRVEYRRELSPEEFESLFLRAIGLCVMRPDLMVSVIRNETGSENSNNRPFIMPPSLPTLPSRYFPGAEVKDIVCGGRIYHSDPSHTPSFDDDYMEWAKNKSTTLKSQKGRKLVQWNKLPSRGKQVSPIAVVR